MKGHPMLPAVARLLLAALLALPAWAVAATVEYIHTDALGSPVAVTNASGQVIERREYEPYGRQLLPATLANGPGYTGHVTDAATGLTYMQQRYYDPAIGRFLSVDPVTAYSSAGANFNRYWYANDNPYKFTDPDGRFVQFIAPIVFGVMAILHSEPANAPEPGEQAESPSPAGALDAVPGGRAVSTIRTTIKMTNKAADYAKSKASEPYKRPSNATTKAQRESVQGKPCVKCGAETSRQVAGHKEALVKEYHQTGSIDKEKMRSLDAVQSECPTCSAREGAEMSRYSREMNGQLKVDRAP